MRFPPKVIDQAVQMLVSAVGPTEAAMACRKCSVARDAADDGLIHYNEAWDSEAAFRKHAQSEGFKRVLMAMDMCCEEPTVVVGNVSGHSGIAYLLAIREGPGGTDDEGEGDET